MKKIFFVLLIFIFLMPLCAESVSYVYRNNISSVDFEKKVSRGILFNAGGKALLISAGTAGDAVLFDKIRSKGEVVAGDTLVRKGRAFSIGLKAGLQRVFAQASLSTGLYPMNLTALVGTSYQGRPYAGAGIDLFIPLSLVTSSHFTMLKDAAIEGWCSFGAQLKPVEFAVAWGAGYRHFLGTFYWELGFTSFTSVSSSAQYSPVLGIGVLL